MKAQRNVQALGTTQLGKNGQRKVIILNIARPNEMALMILNNFIDREGWNKII